MNYKAILFDFDGVIGKTMEDNYEAWKHTFLEYDICMDKTDYFLLEGMNTKMVAEHYLKRNTLNSVSALEIAGKKDRYYLKNNRFSLYDGSRELIYDLNKRGFILGLVSGAGRERLERTVDKEFLGLFEVIITGDCIKNCKPDPEPYLVAAKRLSMKNNECLVVENAPLGIISAKAAGMHCAAVCSTLEKKYLEKADYIVEDLSALKKLLLE